MTSSNQEDKQILSQLLQHWKLSKPIVIGEYSNFQSYEVQFTTPYSLLPAP